MSGRGGWGGGRRQVGPSIEAAAAAAAMAGSPNPPWAGRTRSGRVFLVHAQEAPQQQAQTDVHAASTEEPPQPIAAHAGEHTPNPRGSGQQGTTFPPWQIAPQSPDIPHTVYNPHPQAIQDRIIEGNQPIRGGQDPIGPIISSPDIPHGVNNPLFQAHNVPIYSNPLFDNMGTYTHHYYY